MMKMTKRNWTIVALGTAAVVAGNLGTNLAIAKKNGYKWDKETSQFGLDIAIEDEIAKSNLVWFIIGAVIGTVLHCTVIDK